MNHFFSLQKKKLFYMSLIISFLSIITSLVGLFSSSDMGTILFTSIRGEVIETYGIGIYSRDSVSVAAQGLASDFITLILAVPLLITSSIYALKNSRRSTYIWLGTLGYFLYTYMSYTFLWMYNPLFILYVFLMSLSLFSFIMLMMSFKLETIEKQFVEKLPITFLGIYQIVIGALIGLLWLGKIMTTILDDSTPVGLEHYTTLVIQGMDLGFVVPVAILSGILLMKRRPMGYLLTSVVAVKGFTMLLAISAMIVNQVINRVYVNTIELIMFPVLNLVSIYVFIVFLRGLKNQKEIELSHL